MPINVRSSALRAVTPTIAPWMGYALGEAGFRIGSRSTSQAIGRLTATLPQLLLMTTVVGIVQCCGGIALARARNVRLLAAPVLIGWSVCFGLLASLNTILTFATIQHGGPLGASTFIITLSIIPGALIDRIFFGERLRPMQWGGVSIGIFGMYAMLSFPDLRALTELPLWVWLALANMFGVAVNQGITRAVKAIDPFVKNVWVGATTIACTLPFALPTLATDAAILPAMFWIGTSIIGCFVIGLVSLNVMSYKAGGSIAVKKLIVQGTYLVGATIVGAVAFNESLTVGTAVGLACFLLAFVLLTAKSRMP